MLTTLEPMTDLDHTSLTLNGIEYVRRDSIPFKPTPTGTREVVVCDKGWIFVGRVEEEGDYLWIRDCANLRKWTKNGFGGALLDPTAAGVVLDPSVDMRVRIAAVLTRHPVAEDWGQ